MMRSSALIYTRQWLHGTMPEILSLGADHFVVAQYFLTSPHSHLSGIYYCPLSEASRHTQIEVNRLSKIIHDLTDIEFLEYDHDTQIVWVTNMAYFQIKSIGKTKDKRLRGVKNHLEDLPDTYLITQFLDHYSDLEIDLRKGLAKGLAKGLRKGLTQGASEGGLEPPSEGGFISSHPELLAVEVQNGKKTEISGGAK